MALTSCTGEWDRYPETPAPATDIQSVIKVGDELGVIVFQEKDLSGSFMVAADGAITMPLINTVQVQGQTPEQASQSITAALKAGQYLINPKVTVTLMESRIIMVTGEVNEPGEYSFRDGMTVLDIVSKAKGFTYRADQQDFDIIRKLPNQTEKVMEGTLSTRLNASDIIRVRERFF